jgi:hypothetical protein
MLPPDREGLGARPYWQRLLMQSWPIGHWDCEVHCGLASAALRHTPLDAQTGILASMRAHWVLVVQV